MSASADAPVQGALIELAASIQIRIQQRQALKAGQRIEAVIGEGRARNVVVGIVAVGHTVVHQAAVIPVMPLTMAPKPELCLKLALECSLVTRLNVSPLR